MTTLSMLRYIGRQPRIHIEHTGPETSPNGKGVMTTSKSSFFLPVALLALAGCLNGSEKPGLASSPASKATVMRYARVH